MSIWNSGFGKADSPPRVGGIIQSFEGRGRSNSHLYPVSLLELGISPHLLLPSDWDLHHGLPWFSGLWTPLNYTPSFLGFPAWRQHIMGLLSLHDHMSWSLKINQSLSLSLYLYRSIYICIRICTYIIVSVSLENTNTNTSAGLWYRFLKWDIRRIDHNEKIWYTEWQWNELLFIKTPPKWVKQQATE